MSSMPALQLVTLHVTFGLFSWKTPTTPRILQPPSAGASPTALSVTSRVSWRGRSRQAVLLGETIW